MVLKVSSRVDYAVLTQRAANAGGPQKCEKGNAAKTERTAPRDAPEQQDDVEEWKLLQTKISR